MNFIIVGCPPRLVRVAKGVVVRVIKAQIAIPEYGNVNIYPGTLNGNGCSQKHAMILEDKSHKIRRIENDD